MDINDVFEEAKTIRDRASKLIRADNSVRFANKHAHLNRADPVDPLLSENERDSMTLVGNQSEIIMLAANSPDYSPEQLAGIEAVLMAVRASAQLAHLDKIEARVAQRENAATEAANRVLSRVTGEIEDD